MRPLFFVIGSTVPEFCSADMICWRPEEQHNHLINELYNESSDTRLAKDERTATSAISRPFPGTVSN